MSERTDSQVNKIIHTERGYCPPEWKGGFLTPCNYTSENTPYLTALKEFKEKDWWSDFIRWKVLGYTHEFTAIMFDCSKGSHALAEFLEGREG